MVLSSYVLVAWRYEVFLAELVRLDVIAVAFCRCFDDVVVSQLCEKLSKPHDAFDEHVHGHIFIVCRGQTDVMHS